MTHAPANLAPRILSEDDARAYLGGRVSPGAVMPAIRLGGRNVWDRVALDQKLDEIFGVVRETSESEGSALDRWRRGKQRGAQDAA